MSLRALIAAALLLPAPQVWAQSRDSDAELEALIPDAALDNPEAWARDTDAGRTSPPPDIEALLGGEAPLAPLPDIAGITVPWPDTQDLPAIAPLAPDPDIAVAEEQARAAGEALDATLPETGTAAARLVDAIVDKAGNQVEIAFPRDADFPAREAVVERFRGLSSLNALDDEDDNLAQLSRRAREDIDLLQRILRIEGYYDAAVTQSLSGIAVPAEGSAAATGPVDVRKATVRFDVVPGPRYALARIDLGDADRVPDATGLRAAFGLQPGDPASTDRIIEARTRLDAALGEASYTFSKVGEPSLVVDHQPHTADLTIPVVTGGKYRFGRVTSSLPRYLSGRHLEEIARFEPGDPWRRSLQDDLRQAILATGLVSAVTLTARETAPPTAGEPGTVDVDVAITKAPQRTLAGLVGYSSGEGLRLEGSWEHRNLFPPEGLLRVRGVLGTREQLAGVTFRRNNFLGRDQVLTADLYAQTRKTDAYNARTLSAIVGFEKQTTLLFQKPWVWAAGIEAVATSERRDSLPKGSPRTTYFIGALPVRAAFDGSDDLLDPTRGFRAALRVSPEISVQDGKRSSYVRTQFDGSAYEPMGERLVLAGRVRVGSIVGTDIANLAPSRRLYAGGSASVRGYGYQAVGPRDASNNPSGGASLTEFSLEARVKTGLVGGAVSVVPFVDVGAVSTSSSPTLSGAKIGVGVGVRYQTNFGPIRIDLGTPLNPSKGDSRIGVYIALGQAF